MRYFPATGWLAMILGGALTTHCAWAGGAGGDLFPEPSQDYLLSDAPGYLGVDLGEIDPDRMSALKLKDMRGAEVLTVDHDAPAGKAGLRVHDVIQQMNGQPIEGVDQLRRMLRKIPAGRTVAFVIVRNGDPMNVSVQLCDRAALEQQAWSQHFSVPAPMSSSPIDGGQSFLGSSPVGGSHFLGSLIPNALYVGADVNPVRMQLADYFGVKRGSGLLVENVDDQSPASRAGLKAGDVILKVDADQMSTRGDWLRAIRDHRGQQVQLTIVRNKRQQTLTMTAGRPKKKS